MIKMRKIFVKVDQFLTEVLDQALLKIHWILLF